MELRLNRLFSILLFLCSLEYTVLGQSSEAHASKVVVKKLEPPLFLSPLIGHGKIAEAREKARVKHRAMKDVESYSGYLTVNSEFNSNLFFWYFPSNENPTTDPLVLWLQGGPGESSLFGLFNENGPFAITKSNKLELRNISWSNNHNVLYIDSPVGTGFSFTDYDAGYAMSVNDVAYNLYIALQQFFLLFPELRKNEFYATGESYSGKYIPALAYMIHKANENDRIEKINLAGLAIGNGNIDTINQLEYADYLYEIGLIDEKARGKFQQSQEKIKDLIRKEKYIEATNAYDLLIRGFLSNFPSLFVNSTGINYLYNYMLTKEPESFIWYENWVQQISVRNAIHVGSVEFFPSSDKVNELMVEDIMRSVVDIVDILLEHYRVLLYFGQLDLALPISISRKFLQNLDWSGAEEYKRAPRNLWFVEKKLAGYTKCAPNLTEVLIRNGGHMVPAEQPLWTWSMLSDFTRHKSLC